MRDLIHWISQYIEMTWFNERLHIMRDSIYWGQNLKTEKKKNFCPQYIESLNISNLSFYQVISIYWKIQYIKSLNMWRWLNTLRDFIYWEIQCIEDKIFLFFSFQILSSIHWISQYMKSLIVSSHLNILRDSIYQVSHCIKSSQCIKRFPLLT